jgi:Flp pilus assembly pilin Flp
MNAFDGSFDLGEWKSPPHILSNHGPSLAQYYLWSGGVKLVSATKMFIRARESVARVSCGQTMTEYALILAAIAVVVYGVYAAMGNNIGSLANGVDSALTNA